MNTTTPTLYITDLLADHRATCHPSELEETITPWFPEAPREVLAVIDELADAVLNPRWAIPNSEELCAYLGIRIDRTPGTDWLRYQLEQSAANIIGFNWEALCDIHSMIDMLEGLVVTSLHELTPTEIRAVVVSHSLLSIHSPVPYQLTDMGLAVL